MLGSCSLPRDITVAYLECHLKAMNIEYWKRRWRCSSIRWRADPYSCSAAQIS